MKTFLAILSTTRKLLNAAIGSIIIPFCVWCVESMIYASPNNRTAVPLGIITLVLAAVWLALIVIQLITKKLKFVEPLFFFAGILSFVICLTYYTYIYICIS